MRIKSFSEARGIFESEEFSLEPHIYCFGGGGGGTDGSDRDAGRSGPSAGDPGSNTDGAGRDAGRSGPSAGDPGGGGSSRDGGDSYSGFGGDGGPSGPSGSGGRDSDPMGMGDLAAAASAATGGTTDTGAAEAALDALDSGLGGGDGDADITVTYPSAAAEGPSLIDSYLEGPMTADISTPMTGGAFVDPTTGRGIMSDIPSMDYSTMSNLGNIADPGSDQDSLLGQIGPGGDVYDYSTDDIFGDLTDEQTRQQELVSQLRAGTPAASIVNPVRAPAKVGARAETISRDEQAEAEVQARNALSGITDTRTGLQTGTVARDTVMSPSASDIFGDETMTDEERAASNAELAAIDARAAAAQNALAAGTPAAAQIQEARGNTAPTEMATRPGYTPSSPSQRKGSNALFEEPMPSGVPREMRTQAEAARSSALGPADITITGGTPDFSFTRDVLGVDQSIPQMSLAPESRPSQFDRQARMGEVAGPMSMAPVEATRFSGEDMMRQADDVLAARAVDEAVFGDPSDMPLMTVRAGMELVNALESTFGGNQARKIADVANRPGGALVRDPASGEVLGAVGPEENIRSAFMGAQDAVYVGDPRGYEQGVEIGTSILGPDTTVRDFGTQDPFTGELEGRPGADYSTPAVSERDGDGGGGNLRDGGGQPIIPPPLPEEYLGRDVVGDYQYESREPISYAYTGLPSLAPTRLQPSFRARGSYSPLFPIG